MRKKQGPTLGIDRVFRGVGRIKKRTGTTNPAVKRKLDTMLTVLFDDSRLDLLRAIRENVITLKQAHDAYQRRALHELPTAATAKPLDAAMVEWIERHDCSPEHRASLGTSRRYLKAANQTALIADLPRLVEQLRPTLGVEHPQSFNHVRNAALAFVRATLKRSHRLWIEVAAVEPVKVRRKRQPHPLTVDEMRERFPHPETDRIDDYAWGMATTGMGQKEYWGQWTVKVDRIHIEGTKREGRVRDVPLVRRPTPPTIVRQWFDRLLRARSLGVRGYDLRRTYANWLEAAGIPRTRRRAYMGHGARDMTDLYERHEVAAYLAEDAKKLRACLGFDDGGGLKLVREK